MKEVCLGYKVWLDFLECKDLKVLLGHQELRVILENQDYQEQKEQGAHPVHRDFQETQVFRASLDKMAHQVHLVSQDAMAQRVK